MRRHNRTRFATRLLHALLLAAMLPMLTAGRYDFTRDDGIAAMQGRSALAVCIARIESNFDPNAIGRAGELGMVQLLSPGELDTFYAYGFSDPHDPWQSADYLDIALAEGRHRAWSAYWYCI